MAKGKWGKVEGPDGDYMRTNPRGSAEKRLGELGAKIDEVKQKVKKWI